MLEHSNSESAAPTRTVILGASGFVGRATRGWLEAAGATVLSLDSSDLDLTTPQAAQRLAGLLRPDDTLVFISAKAPVKSVAMLDTNIRMGRAVCEALVERPVRHLLYVSSDAVYADSKGLLNERACAQPDSLHGVMHLAREVMLKNSTGEAPCGVLRPTLIYGPDDPHNGYGPNMYRRRLAQGQAIFLFGKGEERRDHIHIDDVAELLGRMVLRRSRGVLNAVTGRVVSFHEIAELVRAHFGSAPDIEYRDRSGPMPHGGYRAFDTTALARAFPDFHPTPIEEGIQLCHEQDSMTARA